MFLKRCVFSNIKGTYYSGYYYFKILRDRPAAWVECLVTCKAILYGPLFLINENSLQQDVALL